MNIFLINLNRSNYKSNYKNNHIKMATTTPERDTNESNTAKVTASAVARNGIPPTIGDNSISPMQKLHLTHQFRKARHQARLEAQACATIRTNPVTIKYLSAKFPALRMHLNPRLKLICSLRNCRSKRKQNAAKREHNKKAKKAMNKVAKKLKIDSGPFNPYVLQKDCQLTTEDKRIHLDNDHFLKNWIPTTVSRYHYRPDPQRIPGTVSNHPDTLTQTN